MGPRPLNSGDPFSLQVSVGCASLDAGADVLTVRVLVRSTLLCVRFVLPSAPHQPEGDDDRHDDDQDHEDDEQVVGETESVGTG